jgi:lipopolysaccharide export system permease protein
MLVLLSGLFLMNSLSKYNESIAIRAAGISILRMIVPLMLMGLFISGLVGIFGEYILPVAENKRTIILNVNIRGRQLEDQRIRSNIFYADERFIYYLNFFDGYQNKIRVIDMTELDEDNRIVRKIQANEANWDGENWIFASVHDRTFDAGVLVDYTYHPETILSYVTVTPTDFVKSAKKPMEMNYMELKEYIERLKKIGEKYHREEVDLHSKISFPLANFIILMFCVPLATASVRSKGRGMIFLMAILICVSYLFILRIWQSLGYNDIISPLAAAWFPHILFAVVGVVLVIKSEV